MFESITNSVSNLAGNFAGNLLEKAIDLAPGLLTSLAVTAANSVVPGSGMLVQAIAGPIIGAGVSAVESLARDAFVPALNETLGLVGSDAGQQDLGEAGNFAASLASTFLSGMQSGWN